MYIYKTYSPDETESLGVSIGESLRPFDVIAYSGDLGAGKTALTRGIARGLDVKDAITSPTYTIVNEYKGRLPLYHFDLYRISGEDELFDLGFEEYFWRPAVCVVEWSEIAGKATLGELCQGILFSIEMKRGKEETAREVRISTHSFL